MKNFNNSTVLITGGTGSFGHAFLSRLLDYDFKEVRIFSRDELKQHDMRRLYASRNVNFYLGDVRERTQVDMAMQGVDYVFHAAALKQVPSCEFFPMQAVYTNILGSNNVVESAVAHGVKKLIGLSTDKAVYPINTMGMSKAIMEKIIQAKARAVGEQQTRLACVRYGNVMCSRGSVIPLFIEQIKNNKPLTVTVPEMTRFLLPLSSAIDLVCFAFDHAAPGDIFIKKSPACTMMDLAQALKNIFKSDVPIEVLGIRHGEKIYETLATMIELKSADDMEDYFRVKMDGRELNYNSYFTEGEEKAVPQQDYTSHNTYRLNIQETQELLLSLPEVQAELK